MLTLVTKQELGHEETTFFLTQKRIYLTLAPPP